MKKELTVNDILSYRLENIQKMNKKAMWLLRSSKPVSQKMAIWQNAFDDFIIETYHQDMIMVRILTP